MARNAHPPRNSDWLTKIKSGTKLEHAAWSGISHDGGEAGTAIVSTRPLQSTTSFVVTARRPVWISIHGPTGDTHNITEVPVASATVSIFGIPIKVYSVHWPHSNIEDWQPAENHYAKQKQVTEAVVRHAGPDSHTDAIVGGDFNAGPKDLPFKSLYEHSFKLDSDEWGIDFILQRGQNIRKTLTVRRHRAWFGDHELSDHPLIEHRLAIEEPLEEYFREISDWASASGGSFFGGYADMANQLIEPFFYYTFVAFNPGHIDWQDAPASQQHSDDTRTRFTAAHDWAKARGYEHGFPNFHAQGTGSSLRYGTFLVRNGTGEFRDVPVSELDLPNEPFRAPMVKWLRGTAEYAHRNGYVGGIPTGHWATNQQGAVCGVWLYRDRMAKRVFLTAEEVRRSLVYDPASE
jgi:hypothetical protein